MADDSISIKIAASSDSAVRAVDNLISSLGRLNTALRMYEGKNSYVQGLNNITNAFNGLSVSLNNLNTRKLSSLANNFDNITKLASGLKQFETVNIPDMPGLTNLVSSIHKLGLGSTEKAVSNIPLVANQLKQLSSTMSGTSFNVTGLTELTRAISSLGGKNGTTAIANIPKLSQSLSQLVVTLSKLPTVNRNIIDTINAVAGLASQGSKVGSTFDNMSNSINRTTGILPRFNAHINKTTKSTFSLAAAFGKMYASYWLIFRGINKLKSAIDISSSLTEVQNVVDHTFGNMSNIINEFSETSIKDFGMSILTTKQIASKFQAMGVAMGITDKQVKDSNATWQALSDTYDNTADSMADMSLNLTKLTADLASFYNYENYDEVGQKLEAIFTGQTRPLTLAA